MGKRLHVLVLVARDWTHPRSGGTGALLFEHVQRWLDHGHRVTVVCGRPAGAPAHERPREGLEVHRPGNGRSLVARAAWLVWRRGLAREADVTLEVVDGAPFLTPLWLRTPRLALLPDAARGRATSLLLRLLYRATAFAAASTAARDELVALGVPADRVTSLDGDGTREAAATLAALEAEIVAERRPLRGALRESETAKALGLAAATMAGNVISLLFTIVFARVLGTEGYGSLAALVSTFLILSVPGLALQVAAARETALGRLGEGGRLSSTHRRWMLELGAWLVALIAVGILLREPLAAAIGVPNDPWAAAAVPATGVAWLALSIERGMLQGLRGYRPAGLSVVLEALGRLVLGLALVGLGLGVTGAYVASPLAMLTAALVLGWVLRRRLGAPEPAPAPRRLNRLISGAWAPVLGLTLVAVLQNIDVIVVKHRVGGDEAGAYAAAAVAAKVVIWVGIGVAYYLVPEAARRAQAGLSARGVLARVLAVVGLVAAPMLAVYAAVPGFVLKVGFDVDVAGAEGALILLGAAMTLLAVASLAVQYMLAVERHAFMWLLGAIAAVEPVVLASAGTSLVGLATLVLAIQCLAAGGMLALSLRAS